MVSYQCMQSVEFIRQSRMAKRQINIRRFDDEERRTHGWHVLLSRKKKTFSKFFSDASCGGKSKALKLAIAYRDEVDRMASDGNDLWRRSLLRRNNSSGIPGVGRYLAKSSPGDPGRPYWFAFWNDKAGKRRSCKFQVSRYGEAQAKALAIAERTAQLNALCRGVIPIDQ